MKLLLDTHVLLWFAAGDARLSPAARAAIAAPANSVIFSVASLLEIAIKRRVRKLSVDPNLLARAATAEGMTLLPVQAAHVAALDRLPMHDAHRAPFDHMLLAQAMVEEAIMVTADVHMAGYGVTLLAG